MLGKLLQMENSTPSQTSAVPADFQDAPAPRNHNYRPSQGRAVIRPCLGLGSLWASPSRADSISRPPPPHPMSTTAQQRRSGDSHFPSPSPHSISRKLNKSGMREEITDAEMLNGSKRWKQLKKHSRGPSLHSILTSHKDDIRRELPG